MNALDLDLVLACLRRSFGNLVARPVAHAGVIALPTALAPTARNLAALEKAWQPELTRSADGADEQRL